MEWRKLCIVPFDDVSAFSHLFNAALAELALVCSPLLYLGKANGLSVALSRTLVAAQSASPALSGNGHRYSIVSPWIIARTMENVGFLKAFEKAISRGASVDVFSDPLLNSNTASDGQTQMSLAKDTLTKIGVRLHEVPRLHSKIVAVDDDLLAIGSYNWLSADRHGKYARHETSFVYRGQHLEPEIKTIFQSLGGREK